jgi:hypothetical protein
VCCKRLALCDAANSVFSSNTRSSSSVPTVVVLSVVRLRAAAVQAAPASSRIGSTTDN